MNGQEYLHLGTNLFLMWKAYKPFIVSILHSLSFGVIDNRLWFK